MEEIMTVNDVAYQLSVHPETVRRWIREGKLPAKVGDSRKHGYIIDANDVRLFTHSAGKYAYRWEVRSAIKKVTSEIKESQTVNEAQYASVAEHWGSKMPMMTMEEFGELIQAISKWERSHEGPELISHIVEEMADIYIAVRALCFNYGIDWEEDVMAAVERKLRRTYD